MGRPKVREGERRRIREEEVKKEIKVLSIKVILTTLNYYLLIWVGETLVKT